MYRFRLVLNDGAAGAGIRAGTAVQASTGIDDELVIALRDGTSGASVRASTAAQTCRSDLVGHGKHLHKNLFPYSSILCEKSKVFPIDFARKFREIFGGMPFINCLHKGQGKSKIWVLTFAVPVVYWRQTKGQRWSMSKRDRFGGQIEGDGRHGNFGSHRSVFTGEPQ